MKFTSKIPVALLGFLSAWAGFASAVPAPAKEMNLWVENRSLGVAKGQLAKFQMAEGRVEENAPGVFSLAEFKFYEDSRDLEDRKSAYDVQVTEIKRAGKLLIIAGRLMVPKGSDRKLLFANASFKIKQVMHGPVKSGGSDYYGEGILILNENTPQEDLIIVDSMYVP